MQHDVNEMFQRTRTRYCAVLGDVPHEHHGDTAGFRHRGQCRRDGANLGDPADHSVGVTGVHGLHRVDDDQAGAHRLNMTEHGVDIGLGGQKHLVMAAAGALGAHANLTC